QRISLKKNRSRIGDIEEILIEGPSKLRNGQVMGRTRSNRIVNVTGVEQFVGQLVPVRITGATATSLIGEACLNDSSLNSQQEGDMA
ncbi:MAG TPA: TRAM domain-containing protein, partial [Candidatus Binatia bacterium]|nr:TRAM domain-containing protein [Candidatus Binatia bacterium]